MILLAWVVLIFLIGTEIASDAKTCKSTAEVFGSIIGLSLRYFALYWAATTIAGV